MEEVLVIITSRSSSIIIIYTNKVSQLRNNDLHLKYDLSSVVLLATAHVVVVTTSIAATHAADHSLWKPQVHMGLSHILL